MGAIVYKLCFLALISSSIASTSMRDGTNDTMDVTTMSSSTTRPLSYTEDLVQLVSRNSSRDTNNNATGACKEVIHQEDITTKEGRNIISVSLTRDTTDDTRKSGAVQNGMSKDFGNPRTEGLRIMQEFLEESGIRLVCIPPVEEDAEYNEDQVVYTFYAYSPTQEMHGIRAKNMFMKATMNRLWEIQANFTRVSGVKISNYWLGWPSRGFIQDYMALWITVLSISAAGVLGIGAFKGMKWWKERNAPDAESICASSVTRKTVVSEQSRGSVNENKNKATATAAKSNKTETAAAPGGGKTSAAVVKKADTGADKNGKTSQNNSSKTNEHVELETKGSGEKAASDGKDVANTQV